ncbi:nitroreductase family protein [Anaerobacillus isosaccharinicus]|uniref:Nitroreductase n=1 Tax=Anaerobacillus isosaccharinicus TaxID=1532552 RepID=A0A1S2M4U9_9BACI|nr:nitroreductase family protein [Anaerobacillus isosaccharinicus]MBA5586395.1 nitroreductase family protein [Anaerobacillus isosaccharinicus]QOY35360.1 nitroreductase family protein [Anaerobacillus isosaccharinicus]
MNVLEAIKSRRSSRSFENRQLPTEVITAIEEAIMHSPSGSNAQESHFVIVQDREQIKRMKRFAQGVSGQPAAFIVLCSNKEEALVRGGIDTLEELRFVNIGIVASFIILTAQSYGVGTCPVRSFHQSSIQQILHLPKAVAPELLITLGYSDQKPRPKSIKSTSEVISHDKFGEL